MASTTTRRPGEGADQRAEEGDAPRDLGELALEQGREGPRVADEAAEGADVEDAHQPILRAAKDH